MVAPPLAVPDPSNVTVAPLWAADGLAEALATGAFELHCPEPLHVSPPGHVPQLPPQPSEPHCLPEHCGAQTVPPSAAPLGVPLPVGPSHPALAWQRMDPSAQAESAFVPVVTSKKSLLFA